MLASTFSFFPKKQNNSSDDRITKIYKENKLLEHILSYEDIFSKNSYHGSLVDSRFSRHTIGSLPILISAPHATKHVRSGEIKSADIYTGALSEIIHEVTGAHVMNARKVIDDPNFKKNCNYKQELKNIIQLHEIKYVLDLHGSKAVHPFIIDLGTMDGKSMEINNVEILKNHFERNNMKCLINHTFTGAHPGTVTHYVHNYTDAQAVQIEISRRFRNPRNDIDAFYITAKTLIDCVMSLMRAEC
ncbi:hypothetical protein [Alteribacillus sp. HJP-4]|uniref:hypothetical protein n=1 Tax=Alteribacillus sp. HJP-4 TaxID=2775394 RepID=UPI0035CCDEE2